MKDLIDKLISMADEMEEQAEPKKSHADQNSANITYSLPFYGVGSTHQGQDYKAMQVSEDCYRVIPTAMGIMNPFGSSEPDGYIVDAATMKQILDGHHMPQYNLYRITDEERKELSDLEKELKNWRIQEQLKDFKNLPAHLRQEIVDEAILKNLMGSFEEEIDENNFISIKRIKDLRAKQYPDMFFGRAMPDTGHGNYNFKYWPILNKFTTEQLQQAHADASLEDELAE